MERFVSSPGCLKRLPGSDGITAAQSRRTVHFILSQTASRRPALKPASSNSRSLLSCIAATQSGSAPVDLATQSGTPEDVVKAFYSAVNAQDVDKAMQYIADDVLYEDFTYAEPKRGASEVRAFLQDVSSFVPQGLEYVFDEITEGDPDSVGVVWHVELDGQPFPNARGCSFYKVNDRGQIVYARDIVESPIKAGDSAIKAIAVLAPLVKRFGNTPPAVPWRSVGIWAFFAVYSYVVLLSDVPPGAPAWGTPPQVFVELFNMSLNFFYVNIAASAAGLSFIPSPAEHPCYEAFFNTVNAWSLMFLPVILTDPQSQGMRNRLAWWGGLFFVTNLFFIPYLAQRAAQPEAPQVPTTPPSSDSKQQVGGMAPTAPLWVPYIGITGMVILTVSCAWFFVGRPELGGDVDARLAWVVDKFSSDRVFWAFCLDVLLYGVWQAALLYRAPAKFRFVPYVGLALWLMQGMPETPVMDAPGEKEQ